MRCSAGLIDRIRPGFAMMMALAALSLVSTALQAQNLQEVTVSVPVPKTIGRDTTGTPIQQVSAMARVQFNPVMLTTNSGRALLDNKVAEVARRLCTAGGRVNDTDADGSCVQQAVNRAKVQIAAAAALQTGG
jgi:UrcA family protein